MNGNTSNTGTVSRRRVLQGAAALGAASSIGGLVPLSARAQGTAPETKAAKLGFIALTDAAPLFVADEKGFFKKHGMTEVEVLKQSSWGTTRDNLVLGSKANGIDGAHILTPMPYLITTGAVTANNVQVPMNILARLNLGGQCISVANEYKDLKVGLDNKEFGKALLAKRVKTGKPVNAAMTFPGGTHDMWMRYWMAAGGVDPNRDINTIVVPPPQMVANMKVGSMDTFCVCEPWNRQLINQKIGYTALTTSEMWMNHPEKAFAMRADYVQANPNATKALLKAVMEAQMWCEDPKNRAEVAEICSRRRWISAPVEDIIDRVQGRLRLRHRPRRGQQQVPDALLEGQRELPVPEPRPVVPDREHALGLPAAEPRHQGADRQGEPRGPLARRRQGTGRGRQGHPDVHLARRGEVLRRQGVRPGQPEEVPRQPEHQEHQVGLTWGQPA